MFKVLGLLRWFLILCCVCDVSPKLWAQKKLQIQSDQPFPNDLKLDHYQYSDSLSLHVSLQNLLSDLRRRNYLEASVDSIVYHQDSIPVTFLHLGPTYSWGKIIPVGIPLDWWLSVEQKIGSQKNDFDLYKLAEIQKKLLKQAGDSGYPFAQIRLDSVQIQRGVLSHRLVLNKGELIRFDTIVVRGDGRIASAYLQRYLGIQRLQLYNQSRIERIRGRIQELPFLQLKSDPELEFIGSRALIILDLSRQKASRFDFIIGVLPNSQQVNRLLVTGTFEGELQNQFGRGERVYTRFEQLRPMSPRLDLQFNYPFLANSPLGTDFKLQLYRRDSSFLDLDLDFGMQYLLEGGNYFKIFWNQRSSRLLQLNETLLLATRTLPATLDVSQSSFGLEFQKQALDYRFNPRKGWAVLGRGGAGTKRILRNSRIEELELGQLYDTLTLRSFQYRILAEAENYLPLGRNTTLKLKASSGWTISNQAIYQNEQFRIGGNRLLRGFDEEFIFATHYAVGTAEYRLLLSRNSYLYTFGDYAWIANRSANIQEDYRAYGFGAGISFETRAGLFGLSLAFGTRSGAAIDFAGPKVHFGYVSLF